MKKHGMTGRVPLSPEMVEQMKMLAQGVPAPEWMKAASIGTAPLSPEMAKALGLNQWAEATVRREAKRPDEPLIRSVTRCGITITLRVEAEYKARLPQMVEEIETAWLDLFRDAKRDAKVRRGPKTGKAERRKKEESEFWQKLCPVVQLMDNQDIIPGLFNVAPKMNLTESQLQRRCEWYNPGKDRKHFENVIAAARKKLARNLK